MLYAMMCNISLRKYLFRILLLSISLLITLPQRFFFARASEQSELPYLALTVNERELESQGFEWKNECIIPLAKVASSDGVINEAKYAEYIDIISGGLIPSSSSSSTSSSVTTSLPPALRDIFDILACERCNETLGQDHERCCRRNGVTNEVELHLDPIKGPYDNEKLRIYIFFICRETKAAMYKFLSLSTSLPTASPVVLSVDKSLLSTNVIEVQVPFTLQNTAGITADAFNSNLNGYMDELEEAYELMVQDVLDYMDEFLRRRMDEGNRRKLGSLELLETFISDVMDESCPDGLEKDSLCQNMVGFATIHINEVADLPTAKQKIEQEIFKSIQNGNLSFNPLIIHITPLTEKGSLSVAAFAGIAGGVLFTSFATLGLLVARKRQDDNVNNTDQQQDVYQSIVSMFTRYSRLSSSRRIDQTIC